MKITIDNYEQYVLDYLEGNLNLREERLFEDFLDQHPSVKEEIEGVDQYTLTPDMEIQYPDKSLLYRKKRGIILPFWNVSRMVAAAAGLLLVSTVLFFIWKSSINEPSLVTVIPETKINSRDVGKQESITRSPMPETMPDRKQDTLDGSEQERIDRTEAPEPGVMALQEKPSVQPHNVHQNAPALTSDVAIDHINSSVRQNAINGTDDSQNPLPIPNSSDNSRKIDGVTPLSSDFVISGTDSSLNPLPIPNSSDRPDTEIAVLDVKSFHPGEDPNNTVAYLPIKQHEINIQPGLPASYAQIRSPKADSQTFKIHIPSEFLSETWGDVSLTRFKKKLLPEFIKNQLNL